MTKWNDWIEENRQDAAMLGRIDRTPLEAAIPEGQDELVKLIDRHNAARAALEDRFNRLAEERSARQHSEAMFLHDSATLRVEHQRLVDEAWDVLVDLRKLLQQRQDVLDQLLTHVSRQWADLQEQRDAAFAKAEAAEMRRHRGYVRQNPVHGPAYVQQLAADSDAVNALDLKIKALDEVHARLQSLRRRAQVDHQHVVLRQRDVIGRFVA